MIYYCARTDCPRNKTGKSTRIDCKTRMPVIYHYCACEGREAHGGVCLKCAGVKE